MSLWTRFLKPATLAVGYVPGGITKEQQLIPSTPAARSEARAPRGSAAMYRNCVSSSGDRDQGDRVPIGCNSRSANQQNNNPLPRGRVPCDSPTQLFHALRVGSPLNWPGARTASDGRSDVQPARLPYYGLLALSHLNSFFSAFTVDETVGATRKTISLY
ncbi:hypothetical protein BC834DRAFT_211695 [Gloeopeniophorella convolvens]|nr:hypothetical protein BC834DRAFT_211695 [Gloeopeniophorella convolvens]